VTKKIGQKQRTPMPCLEPQERRSSFAEVAMGYTLAMAMQEAERCIQCRNQPCVAGCPVEIDIPAFVAQLSGGDVSGAYRTLTERNVLPAICGRVCPQEDQCEARCTLGVRFEPVSIGRLERFVADHAAAEQLDRSAPVPVSSGRRVAIIGSGPAGLTVAGDLRERGHGVTIFEALHKPGGVLIYGIPEFRLPKAIVAREIAALVRRGVEIRTNHIIGRTFTIDELLTDLGYDAVFIATGAGLPHFPEIPGVNLVGVCSANEYLTRTNLMKAHLFPRYTTPAIAGRRVAVVGGGNTAMDAVRTAIRLGAARAHLVYRRSREEMPARHEELEHAEQEGVNLVLLASPVSVLGDDASRVCALRCVRMALGDPDGTGRRSAAPVVGSEFDLDVDTVVFAVGQSVNPLIQATTPDLAVTPRGTLVANDSGITSRPGVFAGGDIVTGGATVISAMGAGRRAAQAIHRYLQGTAQDRTSHE
jgi:glutamate synthase (NADPH/NADH) small chain